jgi:hypothetical protein
MLQDGLRLNYVTLANTQPTPAAPTAAATLQPTCVATGTITVTAPTGSRNHLQH